MSLKSRLEARIGWVFNYANNPLTIAGIVFATGSGVTVLIFLLAQGIGAFRNPYVNIFAYLVLPTLLAVALVLIPVGMWRRRRRLVRAGVPLSERVRYPRLDFNDARLRRIGAVVLGLTVVNVLLFSSSSYYAVHELESVDFCGTSCHLMEPEYTAYTESPHSRVSCTECHIGPGASWFVRSKLDGLRQVWKTMLDSYERPISTPLETLRPARETCEECHWPEKNYGDRLRILARFADDEANTPSYSVMTWKTGGGRIGSGEYGGIHWWHIYSDNRIRFVAGDERRQEIVWVELTTPDGEQRIYTREGEELPPAEELEQRARVMDCIDCHNRPTHNFPNPSIALDQALVSDPELVELPFFKHQALAAIENDGYATREAGISGVRDEVLRFFSDHQPETWQARRALVERGAEAASRVYGASVFPEMRTDWQTHPNNIGHEESPGCWRCHDEELATADGEHVISIDCDICHTFLVEDSPAVPRLDKLGL